MAGPVGLRNCTECPHPSAAHQPGEDRHCRVAGCECPGFRAPDIDTGDATAADEGTRSVLLAIPAGYRLHVMLEPVGVES